MSGRNCVSRAWPESEFWHTSDRTGATIDEGYLIRRKPRTYHETYSMPEQMVTRPSRGSGGFCLWTDRKRAERECAEDEEVVAVRLRLEIVDD